MPFGASVRTNKGLTPISDVIGMKQLDKRIINMTAGFNNGSFTVPLGDVTSFNSANNFDIFCMGMRSGGSALLQLATIITTVSYPATLTSSSVATVTYRGGSEGNYTFYTYIVENL